MCLCSMLIDWDRRYLGNRITWIIRFRLPFEMLTGLRAKAAFLHISWTEGANVIRLEHVSTPTSALRNCMPSLRHAIIRPKPV